MFLSGKAKCLVKTHENTNDRTSVADPAPNPDLSDPYVFGPPESESISQSYGSGPGSFYHQTKIVVSKILILTVL